MFSVQTHNSRLIREAAASNCHCVRFGSEFCERALPSLDTLKKAYEMISKERKRFTYVTPRLSNDGLEKMKKHLTFLNDKGEAEVVFNDFGMLRILRNYKDLRPHLGRLMMRVPARSPWSGAISRDGSLLERRLFRKIFYTTSLHYPLTMAFYQDNGVRKVDLDWIPQIFPLLDFLIKNGFDLSIHLHLVPVTLTRRCHTARFIGEEPEKCSRICLEKAFLLKGLWADLDLFLSGNAVFTLTQSNLLDVKKLREMNVTEYVLNMNPVTGIDSTQKIDEAISSLGF